MMFELHAARTTSRHARPTVTSRVTVRAAGEHDRVSLAELAALDSTTPLPYPVLLGELDGALVAARSLRTGREIADRFVASSDVLARLRTRSSQPAVHRFPSLRRRPRLRLAASG